MNRWERAYVGVFLSGFGISLGIIISEDDKNLLWPLISLGVTAVISMFCLWKAGYFR